MKTRNPFEFVSATYRNSPWIVISVSVHVIVIAILAVWYIAKPKPPDNDAPLAIVTTKKIELIDEPILPPLATIRDNIPKLLTSDPIDPTFEPTPLVEPPPPDLEQGDPNAMADLNTSPRSSGPIGVGTGSRRGPDHGPFEIGRAHV